MFYETGLRRNEKINQRTKLPINHLSPLYHLQARLELLVAIQNCGVVSLHSSMWNVNQ